MTEYLVLGIALATAIHECHGWKRKETIKFGIGCPRDNTVRVDVLYTVSYHHQVTTLLGNSCKYAFSYSPQGSDPEDATMEVTLKKLTISQESITLKLIDVDGDSTRVYNSTQKEQKPFRTEGKRLLVILEKMPDGTFDGVSFSITISVELPSLELEWWHWLLAALAGTALLVFGVVGIVKSKIKESRAHPAMAIGMVEMAEKENRPPVNPAVPGLPPPGVGMTMPGVAPASGYGTPFPPAPGYGTPPQTPQGYGGPPPPGSGYGAPPPGSGYSAPPPGPGFGAPQPPPGYGMPPTTPGYGAPPPVSPYAYAGPTNPVAGTARQDTEG